jgi:RND superfamily putative drug exporter
MAPGLVIAALVTLVAALTLVPALLSLLGPRVFWPSKGWQSAPKATRYRGLGEWVRTAMQARASTHPPPARALLPR